MYQMLETFGNECNFIYKGKNIGRKKLEICHLANLIQKLGVSSVEEFLKNVYRIFWKNFYFIRLFIYFRLFPYEISTTAREARASQLTRRTIKGPLKPSYITSTWYRYA